MSSQSFFQGLLSSIFDQGITFSKQNDQRTAKELSNALLSGRGEASGTKMAQALLSKYEMMNENGRSSFFDYLVEDLDVDTEAVVQAAQDYAAAQNAKNLKKLQIVSEPRRLDLFRKLNSAVGGTEKLVQMRADILAMADEKPDLRRLDVDLQHLFTSWFNRGFLVMRRIDWQSPAHILEKIISYEAVHEISSWEDLRRRLLPSDRRCYAFFHPALYDEPLIFVEVALTKEISNSIQSVLAENRTSLAETEATTAVFYSISNCQKGLQGISFGNFLIKQVASDLSNDLPNLKTFVTLSPIPGFTKWLQGLGMQEPNIVTIKEQLNRFTQAGTSEETADLEDLRSTLTYFAARYLIKEQRPDHQPLDPVSRFHLGNGASIRQINWMGDRSSKGLQQSLGLMVNYLYDLDHVEENHEAYVQNREVKAHKSVRGLLERSKNKERGSKLKSE